MENPYILRLGRQTCIFNSPHKTSLMRIFVHHPLQRFSLHELCRRTGLTPELVVEAASSLQKERVPVGMYEFHSYFYDPQPDTLHPDSVAAQLQTRWWGKKIYLGDTITSTIDIAKQLAAQPEAHGTLVIANQQSKGRGRQGNTWLSRYGKDLLLTFLVRVPEWQPSPSLLSLYTTTAVARVLDTAYHIPITIKWPNDLMVNNKKLGGVLVERDQENQYYRLSLGLNVLSMPEEFEPVIANQTTSLVVTQPETIWQRDHLLAQCGTTWEALWEAMMRDGGATVRGYWKRYTSTLGKQIRFRYRDQIHSGFTRDIDEYGRLIIIKPEGEEIALLAEEVQHLRLEEETTN